MNQETKKDASKQRNKECVKQIRKPMNEIKKQGIKNSCNQSKRKKRTRMEIKKTSSNSNGTSSSTRGPSEDFRSLLGPTRRSDALSFARASPLDLTRFTVSHSGD
jgi:hypothetical protein